MRTRMAPTLAPMHDLMARLDNPHQRFSVVHVTGTKGKGSVCALLEAALYSAGVRVGRYSSPHIFSICERVSICRRNVDDNLLARALDRVLDARDEACLAGTPAKDATWFDAMTAAAFWVFAQQRVEWVAVEVGIGGRLDSTNVVHGTICVVTNVALEHTEVLGNTLSAIAREKGGIIKTGSIVVSGVAQDCAAHVVLGALAKERAAVLVTVPRRTGIIRQNVEIAGAVLDQLGILGSCRALTSPIGRNLLDVTMVKSAGLPGRVEVNAIATPVRQVAVVLDGAHVDIALHALFEELADAPWATDPMVALFALGRDKNPKRMLSVLRQRASRVIFTPLDHRDSWSPDELCAVARELGISSGVAGDPRRALDTCLSLVCDRGWILVAGSLHLIAPVRNELKVCEALSQAAAIGAK